MKFGMILALYDARQRAEQAERWAESVSRVARRHALEIDFLYAELEKLGKTPGGSAAAAGIIHRIHQLAARRNPEGRAYEGPEATQ